MKKIQLKDLKLSIPEISILESRQLMGGMAGYIAELVVIGNPNNEFENDKDINKGDERDADNNSDNDLNIDNNQNDDSLQTNASHTVPNGECIIGAVWDALIRIGGDSFKTTSIYDTIKNYIENTLKLSLDSNGYPTNTNSVKDILENFFDTSRGGENALIDFLKDGIAFARIDADQNGTWEHAVILLGYNEETNQFIYYDPVNGGDTHSIDKEYIIDPFFINGIKR